MSKTDLLMQNDGGGSTYGSREFFTERFLTSTGVVQADSDGDGVLDGDDNCPSTPNANQHATDGDGIGDECDPFPGSTMGCKATGGGRVITALGSTATFGMVAQAKTATQVRGEQTYIDHSTLNPVRFKSITTLSAICEGNAVTIRGTGEADGQPVEYRIDAVDHGENGSLDTFRIRLSNGYDSGIRPLEGGNLQVND